MTSRLRIVAATTIAVATVVAIGLAATGGGSTGGSHSPVRSAAGTTVPQLQSSLLAAGEFPVGWQTQSSPSNGIGCLANLIEPPEVTVSTSSQISFSAGQGLPQVVERLATYPDTTAAYAKILAGLNNCKRVEGEIDGTHLSGTLKRMTIGHHGQTSVAFAATFAGQGEQLADNVAIVRQGNVILGIDEGGFDPLDLRQFDAIVSAAAQKLS
jgi:hypothetical protein